MKSSCRILLPLVLLLSVSSGLAAETHPLTVHDLVMFNRITELAVSPQGRWAAFTQRTTDLAANRGRTDLWLVGADGQGLRQLTSHEAGDGSPAWSPDGRWVYFLSSRSGSDQVWRLPVDGGEAQPVTRLPLEVGGFKLSPDGKLLALTLEVYPDCATLECTVKRQEEDSKRPASGRLYTKLMVRHWDAWEDQLRSHIVVVPVAGGPAVDLMKGMDADCPGKPFNGMEDVAFTPDGQGLVFAAKDEGVAEAWTTNFDLFLVPLDGSAPPRRLTAANPAMDVGPRFSPDGKTLAYLAMSRAGYEADRQRIMLRSWPAGPERELAPGWDFSPADIAWSPDGKTIFAAADHRGQHALFALDAVSGAAREIVSKGTVRQFVPTPEGVIYGLDHLRSPVDLYFMPAAGGPARQLTQVNALHLAGVRMGEAEQFTFKGWNDETVYGYLVKPADFDPAKKYPIAFLIHGGPQGSFGNDFHYRWNPQTYAGAGYAAVMIDFHGSTGYGQAFTDSIRNDWGGKPLEDLKKGLAAALAKYPFLDGSRAAALGASYGGFMINWIAGAWPDGFRCLVSHSGTLDERFSYFDTEELWFPEWESGGTPWERPDFAEHNPVDLIKNWKTPMLVIHGSKDFRVVVTQGIGTFNALQRRGIPSQFLHFPDENHWILKPANSILWHETVLAWLDRWTKP